MSLHSTCLARVTDYTDDHKQGADRGRGEGQDGQGAGSSNLLSPLHRRIPRPLLHAALCPHGDPKTTPSTHSPSSRSPASATLSTGRTGNVSDARHATDSPAWLCEPMRHVMDVGMPHWHGESWIHARSKPLNPAIQAQNPSACSSVRSL